MSCINGISEKFHIVSKTKHTLEKTLQVLFDEEYNSRTVPTFKAVLKEEGFLRLI